MMIATVGWTPVFVSATSTRPAPTPPALSLGDEEMEAAEEGSWRPVLENS
jgi:hypothetical protein